MAKRRNTGLAAKLAANPPAKSEEEEAQEVSTEAPPAPPSDPPTEATKSYRVRVKTGVHCEGKQTYTRESGAFISQKDLAKWDPAKFEAVE